MATRGTQGRGAPVTQSDSELGTRTSGGARGGGRGLGARRRLPPPRTPCWRLLCATARVWYHAVGGAFQGVLALAEARRLRLVDLKDCEALLCRYVRNIPDAKMGPMRAAHKAGGRGGAGTPPPHPEARERGGTDSALAADDFPAHVPSASAMGMEAANQRVPFSSARLAPGALRQCPRAQAARSWRQLPSGRRRGPRPALEARRGGGAEQRRGGVPAARGGHGTHVTEHAEERAAGWRRSAAFATVQSARRRRRPSAWRTA